LENLITAIVQARLGSTRLPGKVMIEFSGNTLLGHILDRVSASKYISKTIVATTDQKTDDALVDWLEKKGVSYFRGSESNVLSRYYEAANAYGAAHIARITSDDPFKDPEVIDKVAELYFNESLDFACNNNPPTFAEGLDTEIFSFKALSAANTAATDPFEREHVTQHFYRNPQKFKQRNLSSPKDYSHLRWTLDTAEDLAMTRAVYDALYKPGKIFLADDILKLLHDKPEIATINQGVNRSAMYKK
jgi:spore coat polysaccharide biosynthesis protein SpsF